MKKTLAIIGLIVAASLVTFFVVSPQAKAEDAVECDKRCNREANRCLTDCKEKYPNDAEKWDTCTSGCTRAAARCRDKC